MAWTCPYQHQEKKAKKEKIRCTDKRSVCENLSRWFTEFGWPSYIRTDSGPNSEGNLQSIAQQTASSTNWHQRTTPNPTDWQKQQ